MSITQLRFPVRILMIFSFFVSGTFTSGAYTEKREKNSGHSSPGYARPMEVLTSVSKDVINHDVKGQVKNIDGTPMDGVSVVVENGDGTKTDESGMYTLRDVADNAILVFSYVGFITQRIPLEGRSLIDIVLSEGKTGLDEVIVVGYGTQKKINLTGSVDVVSGTDIQNRPGPNVSQLMQGLSPNLNIQMSTAGGEPGSRMAWNLRGIGSLSGNTSPLVLIDGVESGIDDLDPENIESISVLKDASASAIYGSRAPFGVVLITTKRGQKIKEIKIQYNNNFAWASPIRYPLMTNSLTWATASNQAYSNSGLAAAYPDEQIQRIKDYIADNSKAEYDANNPPRSLFAGRSTGNANYDWTKLLFKENSFSQKHNISVSGGDEKTQYYVSAGYYNQSGLYTWGNDSYKRYNILANLNSKATRWLNFDFGVKYAQAITDYPLGIVGTDRSYNFTSTFQFGPMTPMYNVNGTINNPIVSALKGSGRNKTIGNDLWLRLGTTIEPIKGWKTNITYNYDVGFFNNDRNLLPIMVELPNGSFGNAGYANSGAVASKSNRNYYIFNALTSYEKIIGLHYAKALIGYEEELNKSSDLYGSRMNLISVQVPSINAATGATTLGANAANWATQAVFGRVNYNFDEKYLLEFSGRYNGSSRFASDSRWGFFPSISAGYVISKENFWNAFTPYINILKFRASYGSLGNQNVPNYLYLSIVPVNSNLNYIIDNALPIYANAPRLVSNSLTWETATTFNIGLDATMLKNRLDFSFDWFKRITSEMFGPSITVPGVLGASAPQENNAKLETQGFELSITWRDKITTNLGYKVKITLGDNKTTILKYNTANKIVYDWHDGKKIGEIWGYVSDGIIQTAGEKMADQSFLFSKWGPGDMKYMDMDGNGIINAGRRLKDDHGDLVVLGNQLPRYNFGASIGVNWKWFSLNSFWQGILKRDYAPGIDANAFWGFGAYGFRQSEFYRNGTMMDYWRPENETNMFGPNTDANFPKPYANIEYYKNIQTQSRYIQNAAYVRLKTLQLEYTFPVHLLKKVFIKNLRIYSSGENLLTITRLPKQIDPETIFVSDFNYGGLQNATFIYPVARRYSVGVNLTF